MLIDSKLISRSSHFYTVETHSTVDSSLQVFFVQSCIFCMFKSATWLEFYNGVKTPLRRPTPPSQ